MKLWDGLCILEITFLLKNTDTKFCELKNEYILLTFTSNIFKLLLYKNS